MRDFDINYLTYPNQDNVDGVQRWIEAGYYPGHFFTAVLEGDLIEAARRADTTNQPLLFAIVAWLESNAPKACYGSPSKVRAWHEKFWPPAPKAPGFALDDGSNDELAVSEEIEYRELHP